MSHARALKAPGFRRAIFQQKARGIDWGAAGWAGLAGGGAFILVQTALTALSGGEASGDPVRSIAAIALGQSALPPSTPFTALVFVAAMAVHLPLSLFYARILAAIVRGRELGAAAAIGAVFGSFLYGVNYYAFTGLFPWFAADRTWIALLAHVVFGVLAGAAYVTLAARKD